LTTGDYFDSPRQQPAQDLRPGGPPQKPRTNGFAVAALVIGIVGLCGCVGILGLVFGTIAKSQIAEHGDAGEGLADAGMVLGWLSLVGTGAYLLLLLCGVNLLELL
jgi:hypothetical protein